MWDYKDIDYKEEYENFWKGIIENEDGSINKDQLMRELADYSMVMHNCAMAYSTMTNQIISKQNTLFSEVEAIFYDKYFSKTYYDAYGCSEDLIDILNNCDDVDELKEEIIKYFEIEDKVKESD